MIKVLGWYLLCLCTLYDYSTGAHWISGMLSIGAFLWGMEETRDFFEQRKQEAIDELHKRGIDINDYP